MAEVKYHVTANFFEVSAKIVPLLVFFVISKGSHFNCHFLFSVDFGFCKLFDKDTHPLQKWIRVRGNFEKFSPSLSCINNAYIFLSFIASLTKSLLPMVIHILCNPRLKQSFKMAIRVSSKPSGSSLSFPLRQASSWSCRGWWWWPLMLKSTFTFYPLTDLRLQLAGETFIFVEEKQRCKVKRNEGEEEGDEV